MTTSRPLGVTIIAFVSGAFAALQLCGSLTSLGFAPFAIFGEGGFGAMFGAGFGGIVGTVVAILTLVIAAGLWNLRPWAFWATVIIQVINILNFGINFGSLVPIIILAYMMLDKDVRRAFAT
jgi:hypothetical protein